MPQENRNEIIDVPSDVLERLQTDSKAVRELLEKQDLEARNKEQESLKQAEIKAQEQLVIDENNKLQKEELDKQNSEKELAESEKLQKKEEQEQAYKTSLTQSINSILENLEIAETPSAVDLTATNEKLDQVNKNLEVISSQNQFSFYSDIAVFGTLVLAIPVFILYKMINSVVNRLF